MEDKMTKRAYLDLAKTMKLDWLRACAANPSEAMRPIHVKLILLAMRHKEREVTIAS